MKKKYPIIELPHKLKKIKNSKAPISSKQKKPLSKHKESDSRSSFSSSVLSMMFIALIIVLGITFGAASETRGIGFFMLGVLILGFLAFINTKKNGNKSYKEQLFDDFISEIKFESNTTTNAKKGASEALFLEYLLARFNGNIHTHYSIKDTYNFTPDFTYYNKKLGFFIDIEIDEPYVGETGQPIHFLYKDDYRNTRFTSNGWIVVRFAEEQVVRFPKECCEVIAQIVEAMKNKDVPKTTATTTLKKIKQWTKKEAQQMAIARYRNTYLNITFNEVADYEKNAYSESEKKKNTSNQIKFPF